LWAKLDERLHSRPQLAATGDPKLRARQRRCILVDQYLHHYLTEAARCAQWPDKAVGPGAQLLPFSTPPEIGACGVGFGGGGGGSSLISTSPEHWKQRASAISRGHWKRPHSDYPSPACHDAFCARGECRSP